MLNVLSLVGQHPLYCQSQTTVGPQSVWPEFSLAIFSKKDKCKTNSDTTKSFQSLLHKNSLRLTVSMDPNPGTPHLVGSLK